MVGETLGSYRLLAPIGSGGMGVVYEAEDERLGRRAAVKVLLEEYSRHEEALRRFFVEARAAAAVQHPGIVEVYDFGQEGGGAYLAMELCRGETLYQRLKRVRRMREPEAIQIATQVASALAAAHMAGILHRDLKPGNMFLIEAPDAPGGVRVKLMDWGVAKLLGDKGGDALRTSTGVVVGTPIYMSPEQCRGGGTPIDWRTDIYSLGCILFRMLAGRGPFTGKGAGEVLAMHIYEQPPRLRDLARVSDEVDALAARLLQKDPERRAGDVREVADELAALLPVIERRARHAERALRESGRLPEPGPAPGPQPQPQRASEMPTVVGRSGRIQPISAAGQPVHPPPGPDTAQAHSSQLPAHSSQLVWLAIVALALGAGLLAYLLVRALAG